MVLVRGRQKVVWSGGDVKECLGIGFCKSFYIRVMSLV